MTDSIREGDPTRNPGLKVIAKMIKLVAGDLPKFAVEAGELDGLAKELEAIAQELTTRADLLNE